MTMRLGTRSLFLLGTAEFVFKADESAKAFLDTLPVTKTGCVITDGRWKIYRANLMTKMQASSLSHLVRMKLISDS